MMGKQLVSKKTLIKHTVIANRNGCCEGSCSDDTDGRTVRSPMILSISDVSSLRKHCSAKRIWLSKSVVNTCSNLPEIEKLLTYDFQERKRSAL